ncbi:sensor histidine kinase [Oceanobacillus halophilus]|uniref:histidine kinase n=1 Tax=Oceanobacillus halophilus TaxID=930130 RepID=A0A495A4P9_9BACI|nr:sensor histidine kinase [Oceanobacillus halophilus]RKQ34669.1 sensor histidine kinase [Oceanobacillus halophilus]
MMRDYLRERRSWISLFIFMELLLLFLGYLDTSIPISSILYFIFLSTIIFVLFFIIRYNRETRFYKNLEDWEPGDDWTSVIQAAYPFEILLEEKLQSQSEFYKEALDQKAVSLEQEKDDLLTWIHEVKTPLTAMQLMLDRLEDDTLKQQLMYEWLRIHLLLDQQLHQRRLPFMENDLYMEKIDLESLIAKEIRALRTWCIQKGIGFDVGLEVTEILTDAKWFSFIVRQLLTNAVKYSDSSDIVVRCFRKNEALQLTIQDHGRGIAPKDLPRIFDKGFTSTSNHQDHAATGMGLYLTKKAANALKIQMDVQSKVGKGTTFTLLLPKKNDLLAITSM